MINKLTKDDGDASFFVPALSFHIPFMSPQPEPVAHGTPSKIHRPPPLAPPTHPGGYAVPIVVGKPLSLWQRRATYPLRRSPAL